MTRPPSERAAVFLIGAVQFVNVLDFIMVMPLGPDFSRGLGIANSNLGQLAGSYAVAAALAGVLGSVYLERFDRRNALAVAMAGLVTGTAMCGFASGFASLFAARLVAGFFGGPATSLSFAIIADMIPQARRGRALGAVMGAFSVASVFGVPLGQELSRAGGWRLPFFAVAGMGALIVVGALALLPPMRGHLRGDVKPTLQATLDLFSRREVQLSYTLSATVMFAGFIFIPNLSTILQYNLGYPRDRLHLLYMTGGAATWAMFRVGGYLVDRLGPARVMGGVAVALVAITYFMFYREPPLLPVMLGFVFWMSAVGMRNVCHQTLVSTVPAADQRARFMSFQSTVTHTSSGLAAFASSALLTEGPGGKLAGVRAVVMVFMVLTAALPVLFVFLERRTWRTRVG